MTPGPVLGVDPGTAKAGYAVVDDSGAVLASGIEPAAQLQSRVASLIAGYGVAALAVGSGTRARRVSAELAGMGVPVHLVDEFETTRRARELYFRENPPRGWRRLIPAGMLLPPRPIDDYAAVLIARRFLARKPQERSPK